MEIAKAAISRAPPSPPSLPLEETLLSLFLFLQLLDDRRGVAAFDGGHRRRGEGGVAGVGEESLGLEKNAISLARFRGVPAPRALRHFQRPSVQYQPFEWWCHSPLTHRAPLWGALW